MIYVYIKLSNVFFLFLSFVFLVWLQVCVPVWFHYYRSISFAGWASEWRNVDFRTKRHEEKTVRVLEAEREREREQTFDELTRQSTIIIFLVSFAYAHMYESQISIYRSSPLCKRWKCENDVCWVAINNYYQHRWSQNGISCHSVPLPLAIDICLAARNCARNKRDNDVCTQWTES